MAAYYIEYPIKFYCNLNCEYCFHAGKKSTGNYGSMDFTIDQYKTWRDTHLSDATDILVLFHGGEPSHPLNIDTVMEFILNTNDEKFSILTNGLGDKEVYRMILGAAGSRIRYITATYHRRTLMALPDREDKDRAFEENLSFFREYCGFVSIRELFIKDLKEQMLQHKQARLSQGYHFECAPYYGVFDKYYKATNPEQYDPEDMGLMWGFIHTEKVCNCMPGYHTILIAGTLNSGDVLRCWRDPKVIGSIQENTFDREAICLRGVQEVLSSVPKLYRGDASFYQHGEK